MTGAPRPVVVLGMHRSGTSTVSRLLAFAGAPLPRGATPGRRSNVANPEGFFEVPALSRCNEALLRALAGEWSAPPPMPTGWPDDQRLDASRPLAARLAARHLHRPGAVWKDPRLCLTLPFWDRLLDQSTPLVLVVRNPLEVAESLRTRNALDIETGLALWERYVTGSLVAAAGRSALVLRYEELVDDAPAMVATARTWLDGVGVPCQPAAPEAEIAAWVQPALRRNRSDQDSVERNASVSSEQRALHRAVVGLAGAHEQLPTLTPSPPTASSVALLEVRRAARGAAWSTPSSSVRAKRRVLRTVSGAARLVRRGNRAPRQR